MATRPGNVAQILAITVIARDIGKSLAKQKAPVRDAQTGHQVNRCPYNRPENKGTTPIPVPVVVKADV